MPEATALGSVDQVGVMTDETMTALASMTGFTGAAEDTNVEVVVLVVTVGDTAVVDGGVGLGGVVT